MYYHAMPSAAERHPDVGLVSSRLQRMNTCIIEACIQAQFAMTIHVAKQPTSEKAKEV